MRENNTITLMDVLSLTTVRDAIEKEEWRLLSKSGLRDLLHWISVRRHELDGFWQLVVNELERR